MRFYWKFPAYMQIYKFIVIFKDFDLLKWSQKLTQFDSFWSIFVFNLLTLRLTVSDPDGFHVIFRIKDKTANLIEDKKKE